MDVRRRSLQAASYMWRRVRASGVHGSARPVGLGLAGSGGVGGDGATSSAAIVVVDGGSTGATGGLLEWVVRSFGGTLGWAYAVAMSLCCVTNMFAAVPPVGIGMCFSFMSVLAALVSAFIKVVDDGGFAWAVHAFVGLVLLSLVMPVYRMATSGAPPFRLPRLPRLQDVRTWFRRQSCRMMLGFEPAQRLAIHPAEPDVEAPEIVPADDPQEHEDEPPRRRQRVDPAAPALAVNVPDVNVPAPADDPDPMDVAPVAEPPPSVRRSTRQRGRGRGRGRGRR